VTLFLSHHPPAANSRNSRRRGTRKKLKNRALAAIMAAGGGVTVSIKSPTHNRWLSAWSDGGIRLISHAKAWEFYSLVQNEDGTVSFRTSRNHEGKVWYLSALEDGELGQMDHNKNWERFRLEDARTSSGLTRVRTYHGTYLLVVDDGSGAGGGGEGGGGVTMRHSEDAATELLVSVLCTPAAPPPPLERQYGSAEYPSCFSGDSLVTLANGEQLRAKDVEVGTMLRTSDGGTCTLLARSIEDHSSRPHDCFKINNLVITPNHPIQIEGVWHRPKHLIDDVNDSNSSNNDKDHKQQQQQAQAQASRVLGFSGELMNFVTEPRAAILCDGVVVSTPGLFCIGIDNEGSNMEAWVDAMRKRPDWPSIRICNE